MLTGVSTISCVLKDFYFCYILDVKQSKFNPTHLVR